MKLKQVLNMKKSSFILFIALLLTGRMSVAQNVMSLSLVDAIYIAQEHSPQAQAARHTYRSAYWNYRFYKANYLPSLTMTSNPTAPTYSSSKTN